MRPKTRSGHGLHVNRHQGRLDGGWRTTWRTRARGKGSPSGAGGGDERIVCQSNPVAARPPTPANALAEGPAAVMVWGPAPWIGRDPGITRARIVRPGSASEWIPARAGEVRPPHRTAAPRGVDEASVVVHVVDAVGVGRITKRARVGIALVVLDCILIPGVGRLVHHALGNHRVAWRR